MGWFGEKCAAVSVSDPAVYAEQREQSWPPQKKEKREKAQPWPGTAIKSKTTREAALEKGVSPATIRNWAYTGKMNYIRRGGRIFIVIDGLYAAIRPRQIARIAARALAKKEKEKISMMRIIEKQRVEIAALREAGL